MWICMHACLCLLVSFSILAWVCLWGPLSSLSFHPSVSVSFLSDDVIRWAVKSLAVQIYPKGILTPCYHSTCRAAAKASSLHDILLPRRRPENRVQRQGMGRERGEAVFSVWEKGGVVSYFHVRGTHLAFTQWPGGILRPGFLLPRLCACLFIVSVLSLFWTELLICHLSSLLPPLLFF